jgi:hypothetical protein
MTQYTIDFPQHKNGNGKHDRPDERNLAGDLKRWLADLDATEALRKVAAASNRQAALRGLHPSIRA